MRCTTSIAAQPEQCTRRAQLLVRHMRRPITCNLLLLRLVLLLRPATADSHQFFLRPAAGDAGAGTAAPADGKSYSSAWRRANSVQWSVLQPGDTLFVCGLGYGPFNLRAGWSGTPGANVRYVLCLAAAHWTLVHSPALRSPYRHPVIC